MKKALVVVSFGTTFKETREKDLEAVEQALQNVFVDRDFYRAYTSKIVLKRLLENDGIKVSDLRAVLEELKEKNYDDVLIQVTNLLMGEEYSKKVMSVVYDFKYDFKKLNVGRPLLADDFDHNLAVAALATSLPELLPDETVVFVGHGSPNIQNPSYNLLEKRLKAYGIPAVIGVIEENDHPSYEDMLVELKKQGAKKVLLMPLLMVCGDHVNNDIVGEESDSWANLLKEEGYEVRVNISGLGRNKAIQNIFVMHALSALVN